MQFRFTRVVVLLAAVAIATGACGKYSISSIRSLKAFKDGAALYQKGNYKDAAPLFENAIALNPDFGFSYFFLGNSYDSQYRVARKGEPENDALLPKAVENYRKAIEKLKDSNEPQAAQFKKLSYEYLIAAYGSDKLNDFAQAEPVAKELIAMEPNEPGNYQALAKLYEDQGQYDEAEAMFRKSVDVKPNDPLGYQLLAGYYNRQGQFDKTMEAFQQRANMEPNNPEAWHTMGTYYFDKVQRDKSLSKDTAMKYVLAGIEDEDKAIGLNSGYFEAVTYKNLLIRLQANLEKDPAKQKKLLQDADQLREKALALQKAQGAAAAAAGKKD
jgi:tetratricopeptide (TPR) repeat protein